MTHHRSRCETCGENSVIVTRDPLAVEFRDGSYTVMGFEYERCEACGERFFRAGQADAIQSAAAAVARTAQGLLTPEEIRALRKDLGLTQLALERFLGVGAKTVTRWEKGTVFQGHTADKLMRLIWQDPTLVAKLDAPMPVTCRPVASEWINGAPAIASRTRGVANNEYALAA